MGEKIEIESKLQGVISAIEFPIGNDECAVTMAIHDLLKEGWELVAITRESIKLMRKWEVDLKQKELNFVPLNFPITQK